MSVFTIKVNPITGRNEWELQNEDYDYHQEIARSAFADMLHDTERNQKYYNGIKLAVNKMHNQGKQAHVLDIGTGTGLLSMMAAKCGADSIVACEAFQPMAQCANKVIKENGFENKIHLVPKRSTDMTVGTTGDMKHRANILVTEVFDTELIGEGAISTFQHALSFLLEKDCIVVPSLARVYVQVVSSDLAQKWNRLQPIRDGISTLLSTPEKVNKCAGAAAVHDIQLNQFPRDQFQTIVPPTEVFRFDWMGREPLIQERNSAQTQVSQMDGVAQMVFMWWDLIMDMDGEIVLSCAPLWAHPVAQSKNELPWRDHWMQAVYYLPQEIAVKKDQEITLWSHHDEYSFWFEITTKSSSIESPVRSRPICTCGLHVAFARTRIGAMNDPERNHKYVSALREIVTSETVCLCLSDGTLLTSLAARLGANKVYCIDGNSLTRDLTTDYVKHNKLEEKVKVFGSTTDFLSAIEPHDKMTLVIGEPHFVSSLLPWQNIYFWYLKNELSQCLSSSVSMMPVGASVWAMAVQFDDLWKIRAPLHCVEGFRMTHFDKLIESSSLISDSSVEPQPLWEYPCQALTQPFQVLNFNFTKHIEGSVETNGMLMCEGTGICHGVALWVDWDLDGNPKHVISTGPRETPEINEQVKWDMHTRQGVFFFLDHKSVDVSSNLYYRVTFSPHNGDLQFHFDTSPLCQ